MTLPPLFSDRGGSVFVSPPATTKDHMHIRDHQILTIATRPYRHQGHRVNAMLNECGLTETSFWARVHWLTRQPEVERERPTEVRQLRRLAERRAAARRA